MEKTDRLWPGGIRFLFDDTLFQPSTDSFLLGSFPTLRRGMQVCDLGAGTGLLGLLLLAREPSLRITNVELQAPALALAQRSAALNGFQAQITCVAGDLRDKTLLPAGAFDLLISNPPYFDAGRGFVAPEENRGAARADLTCALPELCAAAGRLTRYGGSFCLIFRAERMAELFAALQANHMEPKRLRMVQNTAQSAPKLFLLEAKKGGRPGLSVLPPLLLRDADGQETPELRRIYFRDKE